MDAPFNFLQDPVLLTPFSQKHPKNHAIFVIGSTWFSPTSAPSEICHAVRPSALEIFRNNNQRFNERKIPFAHSKQKSQLRSVRAPCFVGARLSAGYFRLRSRLACGDLWDLDVGYKWEGRKWLEGHQQRADFPPFSPCLHRPPLLHSPLLSLDHPLPCVRLCHAWRWCLPLVVEYGFHDLAPIDGESRSFSSFIAHASDHSPTSGYSVALAFLVFHHHPPQLWVSVSKLGTCSLFGSWCLVC